MHGPHVWQFFDFFFNFFLVGGCSPSFFHIFIGFATVLIDFLAFVLFPLFSLIAHRFLIVLHLFLKDFFVSMFLFGLLVYLGFG